MAWPLLCLQECPINAVGLEPSPIWKAGAEQLLGLGFFLIGRKLPLVLSTLGNSLYFFNVSIIIWHLASYSSISAFFHPPPSAPSWKGKVAFTWSIWSVWVSIPLCLFRVGGLLGGSLYGKPSWVQTLILLCLFSFLCIKHYSNQYLVCCPHWPPLTHRRHSGLKSVGFCFWWLAL